MRAQFHDTVSQSHKSKIHHLKSWKRSFLNINLAWHLVFVLFVSFVANGQAQTNSEMRAVLITGTSSGIGLKMAELLS